MNMQTSQDNWQAKQSAIAFAAQQLQATHQHLVANEGNALVAAGKNIRIELAHVFPGIKFSVKSSRYSGGNSIDVRWTDGPTTPQVDAIIGRYEDGSFDGMTDSYTYRDDRAFTSAFGSAKYIHSQRDYSDKMLASVIARVCHRLGGVDRSVEQCIADYKRGDLWNVKTSGGCDLSREINIALSRHTYCIAKSVQS